MKRSTIVYGTVLSLLAGVVVGRVAGGGSAEEVVNEPGTKSAERMGRGGRPPAPQGVAGMVKRVEGLDGTSRKMKAAYALAMSVSLEEIEEWMDGDYFDTDDPRVDNFFYRILYDRYLDADPEGFLGYCLRKDFKTDVAHRYMGEWTRRDPEAAREFLMGRGDRRDFEKVVGSVLAEIAKLDPGAALELVGEIEDRVGAETRLTTKGLEILAAADPEALVVAAREWSPGMRRNAVQKAALAVLKKDFMEGVAWVGEKSAAEGVLLDNSLFGMAEEFGPKLLEHAHELPEGVLSSVIRSNGRTVVRRNPMEWLEADLSGFGVDESTAKRLRGYALGELGNGEWEQAEEVFRSGTLSGEERMRLAGRMVGKLAGRSKEEAQVWVDGLGDENERIRAQSVLDGMQAGPPESKLTPTSYIEMMADEDGGRNYYNTRYWTGEQVQEAMRSFQNLEGEVRATAGVKLLEDSFYLPYELSGAAVSAVLGGSLEKEAGDEVPAIREAVTLADQWAKSEPGAAARWAEGLPEGATRIEVTRRVYDAWRLQAPGEAERWRGR